MKKTSLFCCVLLWMLSDATWAADIQQITRGHSDCASCHVSHNGTVGQVLLPVSFVDDLCLQCHRGQTEVPNGPAQIGEWNNHGSSHISSVEARMKGSFRRVVEFGSTRAVMENTCVGCHDPHGREPKKLKEVRFDSQGEPTGSKASITADVCFGCHAGPEATRLEHFRSKSNDIGSYFGPGTVSTHRLGTSQQRPDLPSLSSQHGQPMDCMSCHGNSDRYGPKGPHTSAYPALLNTPYTSESDLNFIGEPTQNHLCYSCHRKESIESNQSFPFHREHVLGFFVNLPKQEAGKTEDRSIQNSFLRAQWSTGRRIVPRAGLGQPTPCATCHDPHGSLEYPALIQFDPQVVMPSSVGGPYFRRTSPQHGACTLFCHGYDHVQTRY